VCHDRAEWIGWSPSSEIEAEDDDGEGTTVTEAGSRGSSERELDELDRGLSTAAAGSGRWWSFTGEADADWHGGAFRAGGPRRRGVVLWGACYDRGPSTTTGRGQKR